MQTVVHAFNRGIKYIYVNDDGPNIGYSGRVAYAMGLDKPNYPVPALQMDSNSDLGERWSNWMDMPGCFGHSYGRY
jgi:hypothetical protein